MPFRGKLVGIAILISASVGSPSLAHQTYTEKILYSFSGGADGNQPSSGLSINPAGDLFGVTLNGGSAGWGVLYKVTAAGEETVLHSFGTGSLDDGVAPIGTPTLDKRGNLFGVTSDGGRGCAGTVYEVSAVGQASVLYSFCGGADGSPIFPLGALTHEGGYFYGTASKCTSYCSGAIFRIDPAGNYSDLGGFPDSGLYGYNPAAGVIHDSDGNLYGTARFGGGCNDGTIFKFQIDGEIESVLATFCDDDSGPDTGLTLAKDGFLYGTIYAGGNQHEGLIYRIDRDGSGFQVLYQFADPERHGAYPLASLLADHRGNFYGTTDGGGLNSVGTAFIFTRKGRLRVLYSFGSFAGDGTHPEAELVSDRAGNLYGTTVSGGTHNCGTVFELVKQ